LRILKQNVYANCSLRLKYYTASYCYWNTILDMKKAPVFGMVSQPYTS